MIFINTDIMEYIDVKNIALKVFEEYLPGVYDVKDPGGYFLFKTESGRITHFKVKGAKGWEFGMWLTKDENNENKFTIELFGEHEDYIDKFKPSRTKISFKDEYDFHENTDDAYLCFCDFIDEIFKIKAAPLYYKYFAYGVSKWKQQSFLGFTFSQLWFYRIKYPISKFLKYEGKTLLCKIFVFPFKFYPGITSIDVKNCRGEYYIPHVMIDICSENEEASDKLFDSKFMEKFERFANRNNISINYFYETDEEETTKEE